MSHTKGPWHFAYDGPSLPIVCTDKAVIALVRNGEKYDSSEIKANARLIAAAPELLEIAHYLVKRQKEDRNVTYVLAVAMAQAAIAKAEGRDGE